MQGSPVSMSVTPAPTTPSTMMSMSYSTIEQAPAALAASLDADEDLSDKLGRVFKNFLSGDEVRCLSLLCECSPLSLFSFVSQLYMF